MKLEEIERRGLEIVYLKLQLLQNEVNGLNREHGKLQTEKIEILKKFADANGLDLDKISVDVVSGEVKLIEEKAEVKDA